LAGFPWPLDGIQNWLEGLWNWVSDAVNMAASWMLDNLFKPFVDWYTSIRDALYEHVKEASDSIWPLIKDVPWPWRGILQFFLMPIAVAITVLKPVITGVWAIMPAPLKTLVSFIQSMSARMWKTAVSFLKDPVGTLGPVIDSVWAIMPAPLKQFVEFLKTLTAEAWQGFLGFVKDPVGTLKAGWNFLAGKVGELGSTISAGFNAAYDWLKTNVADPIANGVTQIGSWVADALKGVAEAVGSGLHGLVDWLLKHLTWFSEMVVGAVNSVVAVVRDGIISLVRGFIDMVTGALSPGSPPEEIDTAVKVLAETMVKTQVEWLDKYYKGASPQVAIGVVASGIASSLIAASTTVEAGATAADQAHPAKNIGFRNIASDMIRWVGIPSLVTSIMTMPSTVGLLVPLRHYFNETFKPAIPHIEEAQRMLWRGVISESEFMSVVYKSGFGDPWAKGFLELTKVIPGVRDLITFVVREVITPEDFYSWSAKQGLSEYWARAYWDSHWVLPSLETIFKWFLLHREREDVLDAYIVWHDYKPEPRRPGFPSDLDIIYETLYDLPGRIDARWMFRWGEIDIDTLKELFRKQGLHPDWVDRVARATAKNQWLTEINRLRDNAKRKFVDGLIDEATLRANLEALGYPPDWIEYHVQDAIQDREAEHTKALIDNYLDGYYKGLITYEVLEDNLRDVIVDPVTLRLTLEKAYIRKNPGLKAGVARG